MASPQMVGVAVLLIMAVVVAPLNPLPMVVEEVLEILMVMQATLAVHTRSPTSLP